MRRKDGLFLMKKGAIEMSFGWIFAIIAGIVIIFLAIYFSTKLVGTEREAVSAETGTEIGVLLDPLETGFEASQSTSIGIPVETRINNKCDLTGTFGKQRIMLDQKNFNKWSKTNTDVIFPNKYIFSNFQIEGKRFYIFSKPFEFPFKVADLMYMTSANEVYCFANAPSEVSDEIKNLNQKNLIAENCTGEEIQVCFGGGKKCEINVNYRSGVVEKGGETMYFAGLKNDPRPLMYAAIFSSKDVYECQLKRLMIRIKELASIYGGKELQTISKNCDTNAGSDLAEMEALASSLTSSEEIFLIKNKADLIYEKNEARRCLLW